MTCNTAGAISECFTLGCCLSDRPREGRVHAVLPRARLSVLGLTFAPRHGRIRATQDYPARPIRLIITSPAGSLVDVLGRLIADELGTRLGQTVVIDNR